MLVWDISITDLLFPVVVVATWGAIFLLVVFISRAASRSHDGEAEAEAQREERAQQTASGSTMTPLPS